MKATHIIATGLVLMTLATPSLAASFDSYDVNGDRTISKDEFYGSIRDVGTYSKWDSNDDGLLNDEELGAVDPGWNAQTFDADANGYVDAGEFYDGYYSTGDANEDGHWDNDEWDDAGQQGVFDW